MTTNFSTSVNGVAARSWDEGEEVIAGEPSLEVMGPRLERLKALEVGSIARTSSDRGRASLGLEGGKVPSGERGASCVALKYAIEDCLRDGGGRVADKGSMGDDPSPDGVLMGECVYRLVRLDRASPDSQMGVPRGLDAGDSRVTSLSWSGLGTEVVCRLVFIIVEEAGEDGELDMKDGR
jgi:hypothetical protein